MKTVKTPKKYKKFDKVIDVDLMEKILRGLEDIKHGRIKEWKVKSSSDSP